MAEKRTYSVPLETVIPMAIDIKTKDNPFRGGEATFIGVAVYYLVNQEKRAATPTMISLAKNELIGAVNGLLEEGRIGRNIADSAIGKISEYK